MKLLIRWAVTALALFVAVRLVDGIEVDPGRTAWIVYVTVAVLLGLVNAVVRPILKLLSCSLIIATFGLFIFVINAAAFWLTGALAEAMDLGFHVDGFVAALLGSIIVSLASVAVNVLFSDDE